MDLLLTVALAICNAKAYITYHATEARGKKKTISSNEIFKGLEFAGFEDDLLDPLKEVLEDWKDGTKKKKEGKKVGKAGDDGDVAMLAQGEPEGENGAATVLEEPDTESTSRKRKQRSPLRPSGKKVRDESGARDVGGMVGIPDEEGDSAMEGDEQSAAEDSEREESAAEEEENEPAEDAQDEVSEQEDEESEAQNPYADDDGEIRLRDEEEHVRLDPEYSPDRGSTDGVSEQGGEEMDEDELKAAEYGERDGEMVVDIEERMDARY